MRERNTRIRYYVDNFIFLRYLLLNLSQICIYKDTHLHFISTHFANIYMYVYTCIFIYHTLIDGLLMTMSNEQAKIRGNKFWKKDNQSTVPYSTLLYTYLPTRKQHFLYMNEIFYIFQFRSHNKQITDCNNKTLNSKYITLITMPTFRSSGWFRSVTVTTTLKHKVNINASAIESRAISILLTVVAINWPSFNLPPSNSIGTNFVRIHSSFVRSSSLISNAILLQHDERYRKYNPLELDANAREVITCKAIDQLYGEPQQNYYLPLQR